MHTIEKYLKHAGLNTEDYRNIDLNMALGSARVDSRLVTKGDVFFALEGQNQNGEIYIPSAFKNGAALVFASKKCGLDSPYIIKVEDVYQSFKRIVKERLEELKPRIIGITGSVGKTSTRNFCYQVLSEKYKVHKAMGNYNTAVGIMMTTMDAPDDTEILLLEMGVDTAGEMEELTAIAPPSMAIITNIGQAHLERFGSRRGIFKEKSGIFRHFKEDGLLILRGGDDCLDEIGKTTFTVNRLYQNSYPEELPPSRNYLVYDIRSDIGGTEFKLAYGAEVYSFKIRQIGEHMAFDASIAAILGLSLGLTEAEIGEGLRKAKLEKMRFEVLRGPYYTVINDCYNSSFMSLKASLLTAIKIKEERLIAVIGDILEIGENPALEHEKIGRELSKMDIDLIYFYGSGMKHAYEVYENEARHFEREDIELLEESLKGELKEGDLILCKASRSLALERVVDFLLK